MAEAAFDLKGMKVLITGAGRGLGRAAAIYLAECGATVALNDIAASACEEAAAAVRAVGGTAYAYPGDASDRAAVMGMAADFAGKAGALDAVVNNAMILRYEPIEKVEPAVLEQMLAVGLMSPFWGAQALLANMDAEKGGAIVNMASPVANRGYPNTSAYSTVKGGIVALTKVMSAELGPRKVRVNAVSPGSVPTPGALGLNDPKVYEQRSKTIPLRRLGHEDDNSQAIAFLLSPAASFINGEILNVDGGIAAAG